jgi:hypothetical protein
VQDIYFVHRDGPQAAGVQIFLRQLLQFDDAPATHKGKHFQRVYDVGVYVGIYVVIFQAQAFNLLVCNENFPHMVSGGPTTFDCPPLDSISLR